MQFETNFLFLLSSVRRFSKLSLPMTHWKIFLLQKEKGKTKAQILRAPSASVFISFFKLHAVNYPRGFKRHVSPVSFYQAELEYL